jgi:hypothetical protein
LELTKFDAVSEGWPFANDCRANCNPFWYQLLAGFPLPLLLLAVLALLLAVLPLLQLTMASRQRIPAMLILACTIYPFLIIIRGVPDSV